MEIDLAWLLVLPVLFALGWITARYDRTQQKREVRHVPRDVLDGMSAILGDDLESATESLLKAARSAPDAPELHRAVGNLYRRRGMVDRAIEVHEIAMRNPALSVDEQKLFVLDLARDYLAAGVYDRAEAALNSLLATPHAPQARAMLLGLAQRIRDWPRAIAIADEIHAQENRFPEGHTYDQLVGHFQCELAQAQIDRKAYPEALLMLEKASAFDSPGVKKRIDLARDRIAELTSPPPGAADLFAPDGQPPSAGGVPPAGTVQSGIAKTYSCRECGFRTRQMYWQCPGCHRWDSVEAIQ